MPASWFSHRKFTTGVAALAGTSLVALAILLSLYSKALDHNSQISFLGREVFVMGSIAASLPYLLILWLLPRAQWGRIFFIWMLLTGLLARLALLSATPVLATDYYRYLWEGAVFLHGGDPWQFSPAAAAHPRHAAHPPPARFIALARAHPRTLRHINHADLPAIYPPVSQLGFAVAAWLDPFRPLGLRLVYLLCDAATLAVILALLRMVQIPRASAAIYWWNPLLINVFYNEAHMDLIAMFLATLAVWLTLRRCPGLAATALGLAIGAKFWPLVLVPLLLVPLLNRPALFARSAALLILTTTAALWPMLVAPHAGITSLVQYARYWHDNGGIFSLEYFLARHLAHLAGWTLGTARLIPRIATAIIFGVWLLWLTKMVYRRLYAPQPHPATPATLPGMDLVTACALALGAVFLLGPTGFPWYYCWALPFLAVRPVWSLLSLTLWLSFYHWHSVHPWVIVMEQIPVWALIVWEFYQYRKSAHGSRPSSALFHL